MDSFSPLRVRSPEEGAAQIPWWGALLALAVLLVCLLRGIGGLGLVGPDEPRYVDIARAMATSGDWVTPRLYGQPWFEKPVLYYWSAAAAIRVFGANEFAARLPVALAAVLASIAMAWAALRAYGLQAAWMTLLMLPTAIGMSVFARAATMDMQFSATLAIAAVAAAEMLEKPRAGPMARIAFGAFLGAATLAKGPAALLLAGGGILLWAAASRQWRAVLRFAHPVCVVSYGVVALPWYALCAARNPQFLHIFFVEHNFERYLTPVFHHFEPFWFYGAIFPAAILPWTVLTLALAVGGLQCRAAGRLANSPAVFFGCWGVFPIVFFSFSQSKLPGYILPSVPPMVMLLAVDTARRLGSGSRWSRWWLALTGLTFPVLCLIAGRWLRQLPPESGLTEPRALLGLLTVASIGGIACAVLALAGRTRAGVAGAAALTAILVIAIQVRVVPRVDPYVSARTAAMTTPAEARGAADLALFRMDASWTYGLEFYLQRELPAWAPGAGRPTWIWTTADGAARLEQEGLPYAAVSQIGQEAWLMRLKETATATVRPGSDDARAEQRLALKQ